MNHKKVQRLWREEGLAAAPPPQTRRRLHRAAAGRGRPNRVWAVDFQFDATTGGRPVKIVSVLDEHTRDCLGGLVDRSITGDRLIDQLDRVALQRGYQRVLRCDVVGLGPFAQLVAYSLQVLPEGAAVAGCRPDFVPHHMLDGIARARRPAISVRWAGAERVIDRPLPGGASG